MKASIGPIILIVVGALLLLSNLGLVHLGQLKSVLKDWWPALLIVIGLFQLKKGS
jgi:hypothetical protein